MGGRGVWAGLAAAPFLADIDRRDRDPARIFGTVAGGLIVGGVAALAMMILILAGYTMVIGLGGEGMAGLREVALRFQTVVVPDLGLAILELLVAATVNGAFAATFVGVAALLMRHPLHNYVTAATRVRWRLLGVGLILSAIVLVPAVAADRLLSGDKGAIPLLAVAPAIAGRVGYGLSALLLIPAAAAEELIFRGWLLRQMAAFTRRPAVLIGVTAMAFSFAHIDISAPNLGLNPDDFLTRALMGAGFAYMTLRLGGIEFPTAAHAVNNIAIVLFVQPLTLQGASAASGLTAGSLAEDLAMTAGYIAITEAVVRLAPLRRWAGVRRQELSPAYVTPPRRP